MSFIELDVTTNQNLSSATAISTYTVGNGISYVICDILADGVAGSGDYVVYITRQFNSVGPVYKILPKTTLTAAAGETSIGAQSGILSVVPNDLLTVYFDGLAGDTSVGYTAVRWYNADSLKPTTAGRTLDVTAGGEAGLDWANIGSPTTTVNLSGTTVGTASALAAAGIQAIFNAVLTEGYAADAAEATLAQALYEIMQFHNERNVGASTVTVKKRDGSTTAYTLTYSATAITRAT